MRGAHRGSYVVGSDRTTQLPNTHNTAERRVLYDYHPWAGRDVRIDNIVEKSGISVARSRLIDDVPGLPLELPLWMFDRLACSAIRHRGSPEVDAASLSALRFLLAEVTDTETSDHQVPSTAADLSADLMSCDRNQGDVDEPPPHKTGPVRAVRSAGKNLSVADAAMAKPADTDTSQDHQPDGAVADGARRTSRSRPRRGSSRSAPERGKR